MQPSDVQPPGDRLPEDLDLPDRPPPGRGLVFFVSLSLTLFIAGGVFFGLVFLSNLRTLLSTRAEVVVDVPVAGQVNVSRLPQLPSLPQISQMPQLPQVQLPSLPSNLPQVNPTMLLPEWQGKKPVAILLLGVDRRPDEKVEFSRTDTMLLTVIFPETKAAALISLPRDLWVSIPGYGEQRINVAHAVGGPALAKRTVEALLGLPVDFYARVEFGGFEQMVDALGGVVVDVERPIKDDEYPGENYSTIRIYIPPGPQLMDGRTALQYVRSRHSENDFGRMRRQQRFLVAVRDRALQLNVLPRLPALLGLLQQTVATDLGPTQMLALARLGAEIERERISSLVIDTRYADPYRSADGAALLLPRTGAIRAAVRELLASAEAQADGSVGAGDRAH